MLAHRYYGICNKIITFTHRKTTFKTIVTTNLKSGVVFRLALMIELANEETIILFTLTMVTTIGYNINNNNQPVATPNLHKAIDNNRPIIT